jgi:dehydrogenase/reductase SDR family member 12
MSEPKQYQVYQQFLPREIWDFTAFGYRKAARNFESLSSQGGQKHIVLTGANSGLGLAAAHALAQLGANLTLIIRDRSQAQALQQECEERGAAQCRVIIADLALLQETQQAIDTLLSWAEPIDVLINNAGALFNQRLETTEGIERSTALLLLSPVKLMLGLRPLLELSSRGRVINVVSGGMYTQRLSMSWLRSGFANRYKGPAVYAQAKRALAIVTQEWHETWAASGVELNCMHPGWADTPGVQTALPTFRRWTQRVLRTPEQGADTIVWMAVSEQVAGISGAFFLDRKPRRWYLTEKTRERPTDRHALLKYLDETLQM